MTLPALEIAGLRKMFGGLRAINDVSFAVNPGEVVFIVKDVPPAKP